MAATLSFVDGQMVANTAGVFLAGIISAYLLGNLPDVIQARIGLAVTLGGAAIVVYNSPTRAPGQFIFIPLMFAIAWLGGFALRERAAQAEAAEARAIQAERERETAARIAVAEERASIARELHDVVAHAVSVMVLQVGAVRHRLPQTLEEDRDALSGAEQAGRTALAEMRRLLGAMRSDGDGAELTPQPGLESLKPLLEDVGRAGLPVRLHVEGDPYPLPRAIDLSAYRIVQEGLTNALRHARASQADVTIKYRPDEVWIEVSDDGEGGSKNDSPGFGLAGIRERVKIYGGEMTAGAAPQGGFVLRTRLPIGGDRG
ncbi:MAG: sensor histidine kinase [Thermoleophilia bacterium]